MSDERRRASSGVKHSKFLEEIDQILKNSENQVSLIPEFKASPMNKWEKAAAILTDFVGSWPFTIGLAVLVALWFFWNACPTISKLHFDEFPFIFLNLALSTIAGFQAPIILMAQNAQYKRDMQRDKHHREIQIVMEAEQRVAYDRISNMEVDLAVATEEINYVQADIKSGMKDLSNKVFHMSESSAEYKDKIDGIVETLSRIQESLDSISSEHIVILKDMFNTIKKQKIKEVTRNDRRD